MFKDSEDKLNCEPDAAPLPTFVWFKVTGNTRVEIKSGGHYNILSNGTLIIANVTQNDEGRYSCEATNDLGTDKAAADASVLGR